MSAQARTRSALRKPLKGYMTDSLSNVRYKGFTEGKQA
jgi:hypothetical protein